MMDITFFKRFLISRVFLLIEIFNIDMRALSFEKICCSFGNLGWFNSGSILGISIAAAASRFRQALGESVPDEALFEALVLVFPDLRVIVTAGKVAVSYLLRARARVDCWGCTLVQSLGRTHHWLLLDFAFSHEKDSLAWIIHVYGMCIFGIHWQYPVLRSLHTHGWDWHQLWSLLTHHHVMHLKDCVFREFRVIRH